MNCHIMWHIIWVFTVCKTTRLGVFSHIHLTSWCGWCVGQGWGWGKCSDRMTNMVDPDQNAPDQGLHYWLGPQVIKLFSCSDQQTIPFIQVINVHVHVSWAWKKFFNLGERSISQCGTFRQWTFWPRTFLSGYLGHRKCQVRRYVHLWYYPWPKCQWLKNPGRNVVRPGYFGHGKWQGEGSTFGIIHGRNLSGRNILLRNVCGGNVWAPYQHWYLR